jgi:hypothetical protein
MRRLRRLLVVAGIVAVAPAAASSPAKAVVTIGQLATTPAGNCANSTDFLQPTVSSGNSFVVQGAGTLVSWSHFAGAGAGQELKLKVFRPVSGLTYRVVGQDTLRSLTPSAVNTFPVSIAVQPGDVLGLTPGVGNPECLGTLPGETYLFRSSSASGGLATGDEGTFEPFPGFRVNVTADLVPSNTIVLGQITRNRKRGTATIPIEVPGPGNLTVSGKGVKEASAAGVRAISAMTVTAAGQVSVTLKAKGKKRKRLNRTGKVKLNPSFTYTPTGGDAATRSRSLNLKKKL